MSSKLGEITMLAHFSIGGQTTLQIQDSDIAADVLYSDNIFLPAVLIITNTLHYRATGKLLFEIEGCITRSSRSPFGLSLDGDIRLTTLKFPIGYIELCIKSTLRLTMGLINNERAEALSKYWTNELFSDYKDGESINYQEYRSMDILKGLI